jgi:hypothetical protein
MLAMRVFLEGKDDFPRTFFVLHSLIVGLKRKAEGAENIRNKARVCVLKKYGSTFYLYHCNS